MWAVSVLKNFSDTRPLKKKKNLSFILFLLVQKDLKPFVTKGLG